MSKHAECASFFQNVIPTKLTEGRRIKLNTEGWGILTDYFLESVKISRRKGGMVNSVTTLRLGDRSGQITCLIKGPSIGLLFGLSDTEWMQIEELCSCEQQLFYRYFKNGINKDFNYEQKLFYNFCITNHRNDVLIAKFRRCVNMRNKFKNEAFLDITELRKCDNRLLDLYIDELRKQAL